MEIRVHTKQILRKAEGIQGQRKEIQGKAKDILPKKLRKP